MAGRGHQNMISHSYMPVSAVGLGLSWGSYLGEPLRLGVSTSLFCQLVVKLNLRRALGEHHFLDCYCLGNIL